MTIWFILITAFFNLAGVGIISPVVPTLVMHFVSANNIDFAVATLVTTYSFCQFIAVPTLGAMSDRYGRRVILLVSLLGSAVGYFILGIGGALWVLFLGRIIDGITGGNLAAIYAYAADITEPKDRTRFYGQVGAFAGLGFVMGPALGGLIYRLTGGEAAAPLYFAGIFTLFNVVWGYFSMPESLTEDKRAAAIPLARLNPLSQLRSVFQFAQLRLLLLGTLLWTAAFAVLQSNLSSLTQTHLGWTLDVTSLMFFFVGTIGIIVQGVLIPRLLKFTTEIRLAIVGLLLLSVGFLLLTTLAVTLIPALVFGALLFTGVGNGLVTPTITSLLSQSVGPREQGKVQGGSQSVQALARVIGPATVSVILGVSDTLLPVPYFLAAIVLVLAAVAVNAAIPILKAHQEQSTSMSTPSTEDSAKTPA